MSDTPVVPPSQTLSLFSEILAGSRKLRGFTAFLISAVVTAIVVVPMGIQANNHEPDGAANSAAGSAAAMLIVDTADDDAGPLEDRTLDGSVLISFQSDLAEAVSFGVTPKDGTDYVAEQVDVSGPSFDLNVDAQGQARPFDTTQLPDGEYLLFASARNKDGSEEKTAAPFTVLNGGGS